MSNYCVAGTTEGAWTSTIIRDTGRSSLIVSEEALPDVDTTDCRKVTVSGYLGRPDTFPLVRCYLKCPHYDCWGDAIRAPIEVTFPGPVSLMTLLVHLIQMCLPLTLFPRNKMLFLHLVLRLLC